MKNVRAWSLGAFVLLLPISVEIPVARDSVPHPEPGGGETRVTLTRGMGAYAIIDRGCEGQVLRAHPHTFDEVSGDVRHRFANGLSIGVSGGRVQDRANETVTITDYPARETTFSYDREISYVNPQIAHEGRSAGFGLGWMFSDDSYGTSGVPSNRGEPTFHLRVGPLNGLHFRLSWLETVPLYSSGRFFDVGVGAHPGRLWDLYAGVVGGGPFDGPGFTFKLERRIQDHVILAGNARLGESGGEPQSGVALSIGYVSASPADPEPERRGPPRPMGSAWGLAPRPTPRPAVVETLWIAPPDTIRTNSD